MRTKTERQGKARQRKVKEGREEGWKEERKEERKEDLVAGRLGWL